MTLKIDWRVVCVGIVCIAGLMAYALHLGFNGTLLCVVVAIIAGAIGVAIPSNLVKTK